MFAIVLGQLTGLVRGIIVARAFGASPELDAFFAANRVSETLFLLVAGGALGSAFIPAFTGLLARDERESAWRLASSIGNAVTLALSLLAVILAVFAPQVVRYALAPGFSERPELFALTVSLLRVQLLSAVFFGIGGLIVGILNAHQVFLVPALTPALYQLGIIFGAVALAPSMGIHGLAWGVVLGAILYLMVQLPSLFRQRGPYAAALGLSDPHVRRVILLMGPRLLGVAVVQLNFWVNTWLASRMPAGSVSGIYYGFSLMLMAQAAIAQSVAIAAMPTFSAQHALGKLDEMRASIAASLRAVILLALPASAGLILLREPLIALLYQRGAFDQQDVQIVAWALLWYAAGLPGHSIMEVLTRAFYARQDTRTPVIIGTFAMGLNVALSFIFSAWFSRVGWMPHGGLALANSVATALEAAALFLVLRRQLHGLEDGRIGRGTLQAAGAALVMIIVLLFWLQLAARIPHWLFIPGGIVLGGLSYILSAWIMRMPELGSLLAALQRTLRRP